MLLNIKKYSNIILVVFFFVFVSLWLVMCYYIVASSLPHNPYTVSLRPKERDFIVSMLPEGFSFFTKNPRDPYIKIYSVDEVGRIEYMDMTPFSIKTKFGLDRSSKAIYVQLGDIMKNIEREQWIAVRGGVNNFPDSVPTIYVENRSKIPLICGNIILQQAEHVPWAWAKVVEPEGMDSKIVKLNISCSSND